MINIISKSIYRHTPSGPKKVVDNLMKGLDRIGYPYVINRRLDACARLWIHDDTAALVKVPTLPKDIAVAAGPILAVMPRHLPHVDLSRIVYIQPSEWTKKFWHDFGFTRCPIAVWPVGIDTAEFSANKTEKDMVLVYYKQREMVELDFVTNLLSALGIPYKVLMYQAYTEKEYKRLLGRSRYAIWIGRQESQGIALEEALAADVPLLVWDVTHVGQWQASAGEMSVLTDAENAYTHTTSAEYFDSRCGIKIKAREELAAAVSQMEKRHHSFSPREYILENLSLEKQAQNFLSIYENFFDLSPLQGRNERLLRRGVWQNAYFSSRALALGKDAAKVVLRLGARIRGGYGR